MWTTFNSFQWDVNWSNPEVLLEYAEIVLFLANAGVEVLRLDAIAFMWKRLGTTCQNQPEVHSITQALRAVARIACPAVAFKAEAIVGPNDLVHYLGRGEHHGRVSDLAYHNTPHGPDLVDAGQRRHAAGGARAAVPAAGAVHERRGSPTCAATTTSGGPSTTATLPRWGSLARRTGRSCPTGTPVSSPAHPPAG